MPPDLVHSSQVKGPEGLVECVVDGEDRQFVDCGARRGRHIHIKVKIDCCRQTMSCCLVSRRHQAGLRATRPRSRAAPRFVEAISPPRRPSERLQSGTAKSPESQPRDTESRKSGAATAYPKSGSRCPKKPGPTPASRRDGWLRARPASREAPLQTDSSKGNRPSAREGARGVRRLR